MLKKHNPLANSETYKEKVEKKLSNNKIYVILSFIVLGFLLIVQLAGGWRQLFPAKKEIVIDPVNIEASLIIDNVDDTSLFYHYEITNTSNTNLSNITYACGDWNYMSIKQWYPNGKISIAAHQSLKISANPIRSIIPKTGIAPFLLIPMYVNEKDSIVHCLFRFLINTQEIKSGGIYKYDLKNCEQGEYSERQKRNLIKVSGIDTAKNPTSILVIEPKKPSH